MTAPEEVLAAVQRGWSIVAVKADKRSCGPWKAAQERAATVEQVNDAQAAHNPPAWAVVTGKVSNLIVLDFDGEDGMAQLAEFGFEPNVITGSGGAHVYFEHPGRRVPTLNGKAAKTFGQKLAGVDLKGDGGYAIFCGRNGSGPYELRSAGALPWAEWPKAVEAALQSPPPSATRSIHVGAERTRARRARDSDGSLVAELVQDALRLVEGGEGRNNAGFELARALRDAGLPQADALQAGSAYIAAVPPTNQHGLEEPYTQGVWRATVRSAYSRPAWVTPTITVNTKGDIVLPPVPAVDDAAGQCAWLTAVLALDPAHPVTRAERQGSAGPDAHLELFRAGTHSIRFEPVGRVATPLRLAEALEAWMLPSDGAVPGFKLGHCRQIAQVVRMLCGVQERVTAAAEAMAVVGTYLQMSRAAIEGLTTYGSTVDRFQVVCALAELGEFYVVDASTGELVIRYSDLATAARLHFGGSLPHGWLAGRMAAAGWSRVSLEGRQEAGKRGRHSAHQRCVVFRGHLS